MTTLAIITAFILFITALLGVILPFLPGVPLAWLGLLFYCLATDFATFSLTKLLIFLGLTIFTIVLDLVAPLLGAKKYNASRAGIIGSTIGMLVGIFALGPIGIILGPFAGAFLGEIIAGKETHEAARAAGGTLIGILAGSLIKFLIILTMLGFFIASLF